MSRNWGGKRKGSGRKKKNKVILYTRVFPETLQKIDLMKCSISRGDYLDELISKIPIIKSPTLKRV